jgi:DNA-binding NarL/FixJ family response regulator
MSTKQSIRVYLADDHQLFRRGMLRLLESFPRVAEINEAANGKELLSLIRKSPPDVVLLDLRMPVMDGEEACQIIDQKFPQVKVIIITMEDSNLYVDRLIGLGAHGFLSKDSSSEEVENAIYSVVDFGFHYNELVKHALRNSFQQRPTESIVPIGRVQLTEREIEIISLTCEEFTMKQIADKLHISERTVHSHKANILEKIGVKNIAGLVKYAFHKGIVPLH